MVVVPQSVISSWRLRASRFRLGRAIQATFAALTMASIHAQAIPIAQLTASAGVGGQPVLFSQTIQGPGAIGGTACNTGFVPTPNGGCGSVGASIELRDGDGLLSASASQSGGSATPNTEATADLTFSFEVIGPTNPLVLLDFTTIANTRISGAGAGAALADAFFGTTRLFACSGLRAADCPGSFANAPSSFANTYVFDVRSNVVQQASIDVQCGFSKGSSGSCLATVDPMITFDPDFAQAGYTLLISPDQLISPVPEPATVLQMLLGFLVLPVLMRRAGAKS
jgi:hypothetical protein